MKLFWWDSRGYGTWAFVLAETQEQAEELLRAKCKAEDEKDRPSRGYWQREAKFLIKNGVREIAPNEVELGEFA